MGSSHWISCSGTKLNCVNYQAEFSLCIRKHKDISVLVLYDISVGSRSRPPAAQPLGAFARRIVASHEL